MPFDQEDEFERELREALRRQPAPPSLKRNVMEQRRQNGGQILSFRSAARQRNRMVWFERVAASLVVAGVVGGAAVGHYAMERRKGEEAKRQVFTALRITNHAFEVMNQQFRKNGE